MDNAKTLETLGMQKQRKKTNKTI